MTHDIKNAKRIIWLVPERLGDALIGTASLELLKQYRPELHITLVATSGVSNEIYLHNPHLADRVLQPSASRCITLSQSHDAVIHTHPDVSEELRALFKLPFLAPDSLREATHQGRVQLDFVAGLLGLNHTPEFDYVLNYTHEDETYIEQCLSNTNVCTNDILIGCSLGCNRIARRGLKFWKPLTHKKVWPIKYLQQLEKMLHTKNQNIRFVLIGAGSEKQLAKSYLRENPRAINMTGNTSIPQLAALVDKMHTIISSDTGLLHVACARRKNLIALHGPTNPERSGPFPLHGNYIIIKGNSMNDIIPAEVAKHLNLE